jgi:type III restriction enzyme
MLTLRNFQTSAVTELLEKTFRLLSLGERRKVLVFDSPTGSGKTVITAEWLKQLMEQLPDSDLPGKRYAFLWIAPQQLHIQSRLKLKSFFEEHRTIRCIDFTDIADKALAEGDLLFLNWASINKENNVYIRENELGVNLPSILQETRSRDIEIIVIIDEAHFGAGVAAERAREFLAMVNAVLEVEVTATPERRGDELVKVHRKEVIREEMIKKGIRLNADLVATGNLSLNQYLLDEALKQRVKLQQLYEKSGSTVRPLLLVQLPSDSAKESVLDKTIRDELETYLKYKNITVENNKLAVWLSNEKSESLREIESPSSMVEVLVFKQAIAMGWDCPRAHILAIYREIKNCSFGYVYTDLQSSYIQFVNEDADYFNQIVATRKEGVSDLVLAKEHLNTRPERMRLRSTVLRSAIREAAKHEGLLDFIDEPSQDERFEKNTFTWSIQLTLQPQKIEVEIPKDVLIDQDMVVAGRQLIVQEKNRIRYAKTTLELTTIVNKFTHTLCGPYEKADSAPIIKQNLILFLEEYFGIPETPDALKVIGFEGNKRFWQDFMLNKVLPEYEKIVRKKREIIQPEIETAEWNWPLERAYNEEVYKIEPAEVHSLIPFCNARDASTPERKFIAFLEDHRQYIDHWYKNGDSGMEHFSIAYKNGQGKDRLFYVDFVVRFADETIGLFDTKTLNSDPEMVAKHNALLEYIGEQRERFNGKITGGVIVYSVALLDPKQPLDTYGWKALVPQNYGKMVA